MKQAPSRELVLPPKALRELFNPTRLEIYESLQVAGPATIADLAARLGRPPDSLYYHVRKLARIGIVAQRDGVSPAQGSPGRNGAVYGLACKSVTMKLDLASKPSRDAWARGAATVLRLAQRDVNAALEARTARTDGKRRNLRVRRAKMRLTPKALEGVNAVLDGVLETTRRHADDTSGSLHALTWVLTPLEERKRT